MIKQLFSETTSLKNSDLALLVLRLVGGGLMLTHGIPKLMRMLDGNMKFGDPLGIGSTPSFILVVFAEAVCAFLLLVGYKTRAVTIPIIITMLVAAFIAHGADPFGKKELPLMYIGIFVALLMMGSGKYSVDGAMAK